MEPQPASTYQQLGEVFDAMQAIADTWPEEQLTTPKPSVSKWSAAQQIVHTMAATGGMLKAIDFLVTGRGPIVQEGEPNRIGKLVFRAGRMSRGKASSPERFVPPETLTREDVQSSIARCRQRYDSLEEELPRLAEVPGRMAHPFLGDLNAVEWLRNAQIHAAHHLAILRDIEAA